MVPEKTHGFKRGTLDFSQFVERSPLSEEEWRWIELLRAASGGSLPVLTFKTTQYLQGLFRGTEATL